MEKASRSPGFFRHAWHVVCQKQNVSALLLAGLTVLLIADGVELVYAIIPPAGWLVADLGFAIGYSTREALKPWVRVLWGSIFMPAVPALFMGMMYILTPAGSARVEIDQLLQSPRFWIMSAAYVAVFEAALFIGMLMVRLSPKRQNETYFYRGVG